VASGRLRRREAATGYTLLAPSLVGIVLFLLVPIGVMVWLAFYKWDLIGPATFVGLDNFASVFSDAQFGNALLVTLLFVVIVMPIEIALGLFVAVLLTQGVRGGAIFRTIYVLPWVCAPLALGIVWKWIFAPTDGLLNSLLGVRIEWLSNPDLALPAVAFVTIWSRIGYVALFFMAGLLAIPDETLDAARIDGANAWQSFWLVKLPLLRPTTFFVLVTNVITTFQVFDTVYALTKGGPQGRTDVIASRIYFEAFDSFDLGRASVMALVLLCILVGISVAQQLYFRKRITYDLS
jgi:multiple sugar transport system permease protein